jgi:flagellar protein FliS
VLTASREQLVVMLYDGALRYLHQAAVAVEAKDLQASHAKLRRAENIIIHLCGVLDLEQGEIAQRLQLIYMFCQRHLLQARLDRDPEKVRRVAGLLAQLRAAWAAIAQ